MVTVSPTLPQVESITREELLQRVLRESKIGAYGTVTSGSTTTIVDTTKLKSTQFNAQKWVGGWARIVYDAGDAAAAPEGEIRPITTYAPSTGTITVNPAFSAGPAVGDRYELWLYPHPQDVLDLVDDVLTEDIFLPSWSVLTEVPDGDMEQNNTTDWGSSNATLAKKSDEPAMAGARWLEVTTSAANGYAESATFGVEPGRSYYVGTLVLPTGAYTAELQAWDATNSAEIDSMEFDDRYLSGIGFDFTVPATCKQVSFRLIGQENSSVIRWDELVFYPHSTPDIALPWWVKRKDQIKGLFRFERWVLGNNSKFPRLIRGIQGQWGVLDDSWGRGQLRLFKSSGQLALPIYLYGTRNPEAFSDDVTDAKRIDEKLLVSCTMWRFFDMLNNNPVASRLDSDWLNNRLEHWEREWQIQQYLNFERIEQTLQGPDETRLYQ